MISVGVVDDHSAILVGAAAFINARRGCHVVAVGRTVAELTALTQRVDVVLLDLTLADGSSTARNIAVLTALGARVLAFVGDEPVSVQRQAVRAGATGIVRKSDDGAQIAAKIRAAVRGARPSDALQGVEVVAEIGAVRRVELSAREIEMLTLYASGETAESVARALFVTRETVLDHVRRIRAKYAAVGRPAVTKVALFKRAVEDGFVVPGG